MEKKIKEIMSQILDVPIENIQNESTPDSIETWDSLRHMNLILALEQAFEISFSEEQIVEMLSVEIIIMTIKDLKM